jgi:acyl-CoA reductase-like NAD-dependent aldehyde dehydrogenase
VARIEPLFDEEVFGPVAVLKKFKTTEEAVRIANETPFGLGASMWGEAEKAEKLVPNIEAGLVFINKVVASDPRLPFGGVKKSGIGSELSRYGLLEFTAKRTVWVN